MSNGDGTNVGTEPFFNNTGENPDEDGLFNNIELMLSTNPHNPDTDGNNLSNPEVGHFDSID